VTETAVSFFSWSLMKKSLSLMPLSIHVTENHQKKKDYQHIKISQDKVVGKPVTNDVG